MGAQNPSGFMGPISDQHVMLIQKQVQDVKHFQWILRICHIHGLAQGCSISIGLDMETPQPRTKPTMWYSCGMTVIGFGSSYIYDSI